jgi:hypothetical protein
VVASAQPEFKHYRTNKQAKNKQTENTSVENIINKLDQSGKQPIRS